MPAGQMRQQQNDYSCRHNPSFGEVKSGNDEPEEALHVFALFYSSATFLFR